MAVRDAVESGAREFRNRSKAGRQRDAIEAPRVKHKVTLAIETVERACDQLTNRLQFFSGILEQLLQSGHGRLVGEPGHFR